MIKTTYSDVTYNSLTIKARNITAVKRQATRKQKVGQTIIQNPVFSSSFEYEIVIQGTKKDTTANLDTFRVNLEASQDGFQHAYTDGIDEHAGNYIIIDLTFNDVGDDGSGLAFQDFSITLRQNLFSGGFSV